MKKRKDHHGQLLLSSNREILKKKINFTLLGQKNLNVLCRNRVWEREKKSDEEVIEFFDILHDPSVFLKLKKN